MQFTDPVKKGSRRAVGRAWIPKLLDLQWNRTKALDYLKKQGVGYRNTIFLADWAQLSGIRQKKDLLKYVRKDFKPSARLIEQTKDTQFNRFKHVYKATYKDSATGDETERFISLGTDYHQKIGKMDEMAYIIATSFKYGEDAVNTITKVDREAITETKNIKKGQVIGE